MNIFASLGIGLIFVFILMTLIGGFFMWIAAKLARVERASFLRAVVAAVATAFVGVLLSLLFTLIPALGNLFGFILGLVISVFIIMGIFRTSFGKALVVWLFNLVAVVLALIVTSIIMASSLLMSHGI